jgi:hypothetical protein
MRMWNINPKLMCRKHLLGEHVELHMLVGSIKKNKNINGFVEKNLVQTNLITKRHEELVKEMLSRNYNHNSPLNYKDKLNLGKVEIKKSLEDLKLRCKDCKELMKK